MINIELSKLEKSQNKKEKNSKVVDLVSFLKSMSCQILETGFRPVEVKYMFCSCDFEMKNPICGDCIARCHKEHFIIGTSITKAVCSCGSKCHNIFNKNQAANENYIKQCYFHEICQTGNLKIYYDLIDRSSPICVFCHNFCISEKSEFEVTYVKKIPKGSNIPDCRCRHINHSDPKLIYNKINQLSNQLLLIQMNFDYMTHTHIFNSILLSEKSFKNLFQSCLKNLETIKYNMNESNYEFDDIKSPICDFNLALESIAKLLTKTKRFMYFNEKISTHILDSKFLFKLLERKFEYNLFSIWYFKYNYLTVYLKLVFKKKFNKTPNFKIYDIENLNPLQRLIKVKSIQETNFKEFQILENIIEIVCNINKIKEKQPETYLVIFRCYQIIKIFAKFSLFKSEEVNKLCQINNEIIFGFDEAKMNFKNDARGKRNMINYQLQILPYIIKSIRYLIYHYNDQCLEFYLNGEKNLNELKLYHMNSEICKGITKNTINVITYLRNFKKTEIQFEEFNFDIILSQAAKIISININYPDHYSAGLNTLFFKNKDLYMKFILRNFENKEKVLYEFLKQSTDELENSYLSYFQFQIYEKNLINKINHIITNFFDLIGLTNYSSSFHSEINDELKQNIIGNLNEDYVLVDDSETNRRKSAREFGGIADNLNNIYNISNLNSKKNSPFVVLNKNNLPKHSKYFLAIKYKILLNSTNFLNSIVKIINILALEDSCKHDQNNPFKLEENLFENIIRILSFYIEKNYENCIFLLTSDYIFAFCLLNNGQLLKAIDLVEYALLSLIKIKHEFSSNYTIIKIIETVIDKCSANPELLKGLEKAIKLIYYVTRLSFVDQENSQDELKRIVRKVYYSNKIFKDYKNKILKNSFNESSDIDENKKDSDNNDYNTRYFEEFNVNIFKDIMIKYLLVVNYLYVGHSTICEKDFLKDIFEPEELPMILRKEKLDLSLRTEILNFFRIVYINVSINYEKKFEYRNLIINPIECFEDEEEITLTNQLLKLFSNIYNSSESESLDEYVITIESSILKFELKFFEKFIDNNRNLYGEKIINYIQNGIVMPLIIHLNKFLIALPKLNMEKRLILYEIVFYFLKMKEFLITHPEVFNPVFYIPLNKESRLNVCRINKTNLIKYKTIFKNKFANTNEFKIFLNLEFILNQNELTILRKDILSMDNQNFDVFNIQKIFKIFDRHVSSMILTLSPKSFSVIFEKKNFFFEKNKIEKMKSYSILSGMNKNEFEKKIFDFIIKYADEKNKMNESSFLKILEEENFYFLMKYRQLLVRSLLFLIAEPKFSERYFRLSSFGIFKLLQCDTSAFQSCIYELYEVKSELIQIKKFVSLFFLNFVSIIFSSFNLSYSIINNDYFSATIFIKIFKFLCEEHNPKFQKIFFQEISFEYLQLNQSDNYLSSLRSSVKNNKQEKGIIENSIDLIRRVGESIGNKKDISQISDEYIDSEYDSECEIENLQPKANSVEREVKLENQINILTYPADKQNRESSGDDNVIAIQKKYKITLFDLMLTILGKIVLLSEWEKVEPDHDDKKNSFYYDIYFVIIEFLIEMIQGTEKSNLEKLINAYECSDDQAKHFVEFMKSVKPILFKEKNNSMVLYRARKDFMDFLMAFLEEKSTPTELVRIMSNVIHPSMVVDTIVNLMKKLYLKLNKVAKDYKDIEFDSHMLKYFSDIYFKDLTFCENKEFELANRMYQYVKLLAANERYAHEDAINIIESVSNFSEEKFLKMNSQRSKSNISHFIYNNEVTFDDSFYNNFFCIKFFEKITRTVPVQLEEKISGEENNPVRVIFTLNPLILYLSDNSRQNFHNKVKRDGRYIKLFYLMDQSDEFYDEIKYNSERANPLLNILHKINYFLIEIFSFLITLSINVYMIVVLENSEIEKGDPIHSFYIRLLGMINLAINILTTILWFYSKFNLYYFIEKKKIYIKKEGKFSCFDYIKIIFKTIVIRNEVFSFLWNVLFCATGISFPKQNFVFAPQLFIIINLSETLKNIALSVTMKWRQLLSTSSFMFIVCYIFSSIAFFYFSEDFIFNIFDANTLKYTHAENFCSNMINCWIIHMDMGVRSDGGIGENLNKRHSFTYDPYYYVSRFFYEDISFIFVNFILLSMIFGIVIDAFDELINQSHKDDYDKSNICFICGTSREQLEKRSENFIYHIKNVHNTRNYMDYMIGLKFVDLHDANAINSYVIEQVEKKQIAWFPAENEEENYKYSDDESSNSKVI